MPLAWRGPSRLEGPYELDPRPDLTTSYDKPLLELQKAGHGELVQTQDGHWYLVHLRGSVFRTYRERASTRTSITWK